MRKVLFLWSPEGESSMEELVTSSDFSESSVQGVLLQDSPGGERTFSFPCYTLVSGEEKASSSYPSIHYPDMLKMIFEADTVIS